MTELRQFMRIRLVCPAAVPKSYLAAALLLIALAGVMVILADYLPPGIDWDETYRPAALNLLHGRNPYDVEGFFHPVWTLLPVLPLALLPANIGRAVFLLISLVAFALSAYRLGARTWVLAIFLLSPPVLHGLLNSNIDWIPLIGFVLPPQIGLFLVVIKPQVGSAIALFWLVEAWRHGGWKEILRTFAPVTVALLISFGIYGLWFLRYSKTIEFWWNASLWPASIPVGLVLLATAFRKRDQRFAMAAAPCLSPYVLLHSWVGALVALVAQPVETLVAVAGLWIVVLLRTLQ